MRAGWDESRWEEWRSSADGRALDIMGVFANAVESSGGEVCASLREQALVAGWSEAEWQDWLCTAGTRALRLMS
jgi:hypothetical protein